MGDAASQQLESRSLDAPNPDGIGDAEGEVSTQTLPTFPVRDIDVIVPGSMGGNHSVPHYCLSGLSPPQLWVLTFPGSAPPQPVHIPG